ncbi:ThuA domain-containing protein [Conexibacter sp. CPCC 206217]|uniref:ThuA domain-containing protein n=1 Tax=Conexibacter sp. CPCC 206217 TaxID=3064574 RepID=UPI002722030E|nr:ThuA domain-containing protein [Conexibacter sp. CPCC 206217]MDO8213142.1 ThuA domain-containing protein [Conexibacter sp. CPCC 206217]
MRVTVWGEGFLDLDTLGERPEPLNYRGYVDRARELYPDDVHEAVARLLRERLGDGAEVRTSVLADPAAGLGPELLEATDVLVWWSHVKHHLVPDETVERVWQRVREGMGLIMLHAGIESKIFRRLMGTTCNSEGWRQSDDWEAIWTVSPGHPISEGVPARFVIPVEEVYCEFFDIPAPDELVFLSTFRGGEVFRSGCCWQRGNGRIFYFRPGHESYPTYHQPEVQQVLANSVRWANREAATTVDLSPFDGQHPDAAKAHELHDGWFRRLGAAGGGRAEVER